MKHLRTLYSLFVLLFLAAACSPGNLSYTEAQERNIRKLDTEEQKEDANFLVDAANYNLLLSGLSTRASEKGYARIVTDFANSTLADHQRMYADIKTLAKEKKIAVPVSMSARFEQTLNELATVKPKEFDQVYLNTTETVHEQAVRLFEDAALNANDSQIRAFAAEKLDMLRNHARRADQLEDQLL